MKFSNREQWDEALTEAIGTETGPRAAFITSKFIENNALNGNIQDSNPYTNTIRHTCTECREYAHGDTAIFHRTTCSLFALPTTRKVTEEQQAARIMGDGYTMNSDF